MAVNVCRLARKTNRKSRKEQQTEELDAPRLPMWSLNPFAHSLHETSPHFSVTGSRGILVCWLNQNRIPLQIHFPCILPIWRCLSSTKGCMTSPFDLRQASPVWQVLSAASPSSSQFAATRRLYYFPLPSSPRAHLEHYWDGLSKIRAQWRAAIPRRRWWQNSARDCFPFQVHKYCIL